MGILRSAGPHPLGWKGALLSWVPALAWGGYVFWLLSYPVGGGPKPWALGWAMNLGHAFLFGVQALLLLPPLLLWGLSWEKASFLAWLLSSLWAGAEEIIQLGVPGRSGSLLDFFTGSLGALFALRALWLFLTGESPSRLEGLLFFLVLLSGTLATFLG